MIKISDCNNCMDRNCSQNVSGKIRFNCKQYKQPQSQRLAYVGQIALANNPEALIETLKKCGLEFPK